MWSTSGKSSTQGVSQYGRLTAYEADLFGSALKRHVQPEKPAMPIGMSLWDIAMQADSSPRCARYLEKRGQGRHLDSAEIFEFPIQL
jgi:hypothetical protein